MLQSHVKYKIYILYYRVRSGPKLGKIHFMQTSASECRMRHVLSRLNQRKPKKKPTTRNITRHQSILKRATVPAPK